MIKLFISQPMAGKTEEEIKKEKEKAVKEVADYFNQKVIILDSFITDAPPDATPLWYLGKSIEIMSTANAAYFAKGWRESRGCVIENVCANEYGLLVVEVN